ncbi:MAG: hypothetical protein ACE5K8_01310 [Candidatus Zixiibacteriota bacterium]
MKSGVFVTCLVLVLAFAYVTADAGQVCETKEKCLSIAGCVTITTAFCEVGAGETVVIEIVSGNGTLASGDPVTIKKVTPKPKQMTASISQTRLNDKQVSVTLDSYSTGAKTVHLNVYLDTGEKIGVNLKLPTPSLM